MTAANPPPSMPKNIKRVLVMVGDYAAPIAAANVYFERFKHLETRFVEEKVLGWRRFMDFSRRRLKNRGALSLAGVYLDYLLKMIEEKKAPKKYRPDLVSRSFSDDPAVPALIEEFNPQLIIIGFCGVLSEKFLKAAAGRPMVNTHPGINPLYRGFGNIWAFRENDFERSGYTIHLVDQGTDTGPRLALARIDWQGVPFEGHESHAASLAAEHLADLALGLAGPGIPAEFLDLPSLFWPMPTLRDHLEGRRNYLLKYGKAG